MNENSPAPVVVGVDGSDDSPSTVILAAAYAADRQSPLRIVHARAWPTYTGNPPLLTPPVAPIEDEPTARLIVDNARDLVRGVHPDVNVTGHVIDGGPAVVLIDESRHATLVVVGSHGHGGLARRALGSTAMDVAARAICPVLVVRGEATRNGPVVVGVDGRVSSKAAIDFAFAEARARGVPLRAVHAWHHSTNLVDTAESEADGRHRARSVLDEWLSDDRGNFDDVVVETVPVHQANPARALGEESAKASLVVIGSRMRGALRSRLLGSTGYAMVHTSHCPVAIVRSAS